MILLDTHVLIWLRQGSSKLGPRSRRAIDRALAEQQLLVSAISFWETAMLADRGRLRLDMPAGEWRRALLGDGLREVAVDGRIGIEAALLTGLHGDPADRFILATGQVESAKVVTADVNMLEWHGKVKRLDARD
ncbi:MAG: twitching motility protein PilT [Deltaproteobacteria bacterium RBG_16_71_12]|nr:MAG: twitching motility protein PilT [Deltaproteobacteria bacterium RBG_16_71_12]